MTDPLLERMHEDFEPELATRPDDDERLARAIDGALAAAAPKAAPRSRWPLLLAAALLLVGAGAAARLFRAEPMAAPAPVADPVPPSVVAPTAAPEPLAAPAPAEASAEPAPRAPAPSAALPAPTATELFARANQARRDKKDDEAIRLYRELQRRYPESREARASRVVLGQLLLDRTDAKQAVGEFDSYLSGAPGSVTEEALVGRARSLGKLGKTTEERAAWQELLRRYPKSLHAAEAKARLAALAE